MLLFKAFDPPLGYRFGVFFFSGGYVPNLLDIKFQKVSGLSVDIKTTSLNEGGENTYTHRLPEKVDYGNLVLERGMTPLSPLNYEFEDTMEEFQFYTCDVLVTLLNNSYIPITSWLFMKAYPVKWSTSELNAEEDRLVIDTMELAYTKYLNIRL